MEIQQQISELFKTKDVPCKNQDTNSEMDLKKIENQLNIHMKNKQGLKYKRVTIMHDRFYDADKFSSVIDDEIKNKIANKKWKSLPMSIKWKVIDIYLNLNNITEKDEYKRKLLNNELEVDYENGIVTKII